MHSSKWSHTFISSFLSVIKKKKKQPGDIFYFIFWPSITCLRKLVWVSYTDTSVSLFQALAHQPYNLPPSLPPLTHTGLQHPFKKPSSTPGREESRREQKPLAGRVPPKLMWQVPPCCCHINHLHNHVCDKLFLFLFFFGKRSTLLLSHSGLDGIARTLTMHRHTANCQT